MPVCPKCHEDKSTDAFGTRKAPVKLDGSQSTLRRSWCRVCECAREKGRRKTEAQLRSKIRVGRYAKSYWTDEQFKAACAAQQMRCKICGCELTELRKEGTNTVHADHHPIKNTPRAILCRRCNAGLGMFQDRADLLRIAASYLDYYNR